LSVETQLLRKTPIYGRDFLIRLIERQSRATNEGVYLNWQWNFKFQYSKQAETKDFYVKTQFG